MPRVIGFLCLKIVSRRQRYDVVLANGTILNGVTRSNNPDLFFVSLFATGTCVMSP